VYCSKRDCMYNVFLVSTSGSVIYYSGKHIRLPPTSDKDIFVFSGYAKIYSSRTFLACFVSLVYNLPFSFTPFYVLSFFLFFPHKSTTVIVTALGVLGYQYCMSNSFLLPIVHKNLLPWFNCECL
jgi:hypothetical protein